MKTTFWLLMLPLAISAAGCGASADRIAAAPDREVCLNASAVNAIAWKSGWMWQRWVQEAQNRGLNAVDCNPTTFDCLDMGYKRDTSSFFECRSELIRAQSAARLRAQEDRERESLIDAANARAQDANQRAWEAEQRAQDAEMRRQELEQILEEEGR